MIVYFGYLCVSAFIFLVFVVCVIQSFSIDKQYITIGRNETLLQYAIRCHNPIVAEMLLKEYNASPNTINNQNETALHMCCSIYSITDKIRMMQLLEKYNFDFAKLINVAEYNTNKTVFHMLCQQQCLECLAYIVGICYNIKNCNINTLILDSTGRTGLHYAILHANFELIKFLLEHVYFPNNDKTNKNGIKCIENENGLVPLYIVALENDCSWDIFELLISYGMDVTQMSPRWGFLDHVQMAMQHHNTKLLRIWYNYGKKQKIISTPVRDAGILALSARYTLVTFKAVLLMILTSAIAIASIDIYNNNTNDNNSTDDNNEQIVITEAKLRFIMLHPKTNPQVRKFLDQFIKHSWGDEVNNSTSNIKVISDVPVVWKLRTIVTCNNNHEIDSSNRYNKIVMNINTKCSKCNVHWKRGIKCKSCTDVICDNCANIQIFISEINNVHTTTLSMTSQQTKKIEFEILHRLSRHIKNEIIIHAVKSVLFGYMYE